MDKYSKVYKSGILYFAEDLDLVMKAIALKKCVVLSSAYKMGDRRFIDYLAHKLKYHDDYEVYYDAENDYSIETLADIQNRKSTRQKVLLLPWYRKSSGFKTSLVEYFRNRSNTFITVIVLPADFLENPANYFSDTNLPMDIILTRKLLNRQKSFEMLNLRETLDGVILSKSKKAEIVSLSGGHIGLLKRLYTVVSFQGAKLDIANLIHEPTIKADLLQLEYQIRTLSVPILKRLGILDRKGNHAIALLGRLIETIQGVSISDLSPSYKELFELFTSSSDRIVSLREIHSILTPEKEFSMWATYKSVSRFAKEIAPKYKVQNIKGKGYRLIQK